MIDTSETIETMLAETQPALEHTSPSVRAVSHRQVLGLAGPVIGEMLLETLLGIIDTLLVSGLGAIAIAGVGSALQVMFFLLSALSALAMGSSVLVAQAFGGSNLERANHLARQALIWSMISSIPLAVLGWFLAKPVIGMFGMESAVAQIGTDYLQVTMGTIVVLITLIIGGGVLRGVGDTRTPMIVTGIANVINVGLAYGLIYGHFGLPALGAVGSAWATFIARGIALILLVIALWKGRHGVSIKGHGSWLPEWPIARQIMTIGVPAALEQVLVSAAFFLLTILVATLGTDVLAAHRIAFTAATFSFLPGIGFGIAATTLVGQSIGAQRPNEGAQATRIATIWAVVWMSVIATIFFVGATPIMRLFSSEPDVITAGAHGLRILALTQPFWAIEFVQAGALRGTGNTRFPLVVTGTGMWLSVLLAWMLLRTVGGDLISVWGAFLVLSPFMAGLFWWRFRGAVTQHQTNRPI